MTFDINDRYSVFPLSADTFAIRDVRMRAFCSLDGKNVLTWPLRRDAERWLGRCYRVWGFVPNVTDDPDDHAARDRYRREDPKASPWEGWMVPPFGA